MSTVYVLEPPTKGKVVVHTTYGPIDVEFWPKEAPKAVRNFIQLCLEGYYDNTVFHRIIKTFLIQGGDPTGTGTGGESIYGSPFADEIHSRLRFKHRGLVACANAGTPNSNGSQFFVSLDRCDWLDKMHTIFGKVTGDSIYNLLRLGEVETGKDDRPLDPAPMIISTEVLWNPFEDIVPRRQPATLLPSSLTEVDNSNKKKPVKKLNLLSFGEEAEEEEKDLAAVKTKIKSSHDVLDDPRLLKNEDSSEAKINRDVQLSVREALSSKKEERKMESDAKFPKSFDNSDDDDEASFDARMRQQILKKQSVFKEVPPPRQKSQNANSSQKEKQQQQEHSPSRSDDDDDEGPKVEKLSLKKKGMGSEARAKHMDNADSDLQLFNETERQRQLLRMKKRRRQGHESEMLAKLETFKNSISTKPVESNGKSIKSGGEEDLSDWSKVELKFATEPGKGNMSRKDDPNDYVVLDPLLEKGKEKFNKMMAKQKRKDREWAGKSLT